MRRCSSPCRLLLGGLLALVSLTVLAVPVYTGGVGWSVTPSTTPAANRLDTVVLWTASDQRGEYSDVDSLGNPYDFDLDHGALTAIEVAPGGDIFAAGFRVALKPGPLVGINDPINSPGSTLTTPADPTHSQPAMLFVSHHNPQGGLVAEWQAAIPAGYTLETTVPVHMALDSSGNIYIVAQIRDGTSGGGDILVAEFSSSGTQQCQQVYDHGTAGLDDLPIALVADASGAAVLATVDISDAGLKSTNVQQDIALIRFAAGTCAPSWEQPYPNAAAGDTNAGNDEAVALSRDATGNLYVLGTEDTISNASRFVVLMYDASGNRLWKQTGPTGMGDVTAEALAEDQGHVYVTATIRSLGGTGYDQAWISHYDNSGTFIDASSYTGPSANSNERPVALAVDRAHNRIFVALEEDTSTLDHDIRLVKYDANLAQQWVSTPHDSGGDDRVGAVIVDKGDPADEIYLSVIQGGIGQRDMALLHYETVAGQGVLQDSYVTDVAGADEQGGALAEGSEAGQLTLYLAGGGQSNSTSGQANGHVSVVKYGHARPDLTTQVTSHPPTAYNEVAMAITVQTDNIQDALTGRLLDVSPTTTFNVGFYLSPTNSASVCPASCTAIGSHTIAGLASGTSEIVSLSLALPAVTVLPEGNYYLVAIVDEGNSVAEQNETNNSWVSPATISVINPPDLTAAPSITAPATIPAGDPMSLGYTLSNLRNVAIPSGTGFVQSFFLRPVGATDASTDISLNGSVVVDSFPASATQTLTASTIGVPASVPPAGYYLGITVDATGLVTEVDETNNVIVDTSHVLTVQAIPDLSITAVSGDRGVVVGGTPTVSATIQTIDVGVSSPFTLTFYLSADPVITAADTPIGSATIASLAPGTPMSILSTSPSFTPVAWTAGQGIYYLGAIVDSGNVITESSEANNAQAAAETISVGLPSSDPAAQPDLVLTSVTAPASVTRGTPFTVTANIQNVLPKAAGPFAVRAYVSTDAVITAADYPIGTVSLTGGLAGNSSNPAQAISATIPLPTTQLVTWDAAQSCLIDSADAHRLISGTCSGITGVGGVSNESVPAGSDGYAEYTVTVKKAEAFGLSTSSANNDWTSIQYGFTFKATGVTDIIENGANVLRISGTDVGTTFRVERKGAEIIYYQNGVEKRRRPITASVVNSPLFVDVALLNSAAEITNVQIGQDPVPTGSYYIGAIVDADAVIAEVDETNNTAVNGGVTGSPTSVGVIVSAGRTSASSGGGGWGLISGLVLLLAAVQRKRMGTRSP